nr:MAG TPA: hypothetical protein [Caudoviricetes sp.]
MVLIKSCYHRLRFHLEKIIIVLTLKLDHSVVITIQTKLTMQL